MRQEVCIYAGHSRPTGAEVPCLKPLSVWALEAGSKQIFERVLRKFPDGNSKGKGGREREERKLTQGSVLQ